MPLSKQLQKEEEFPPLDEGAACGKYILNFRNPRNCEVDGGKSVQGRREQSHVTLGKSFTT